MEFKNLFPHIVGNQIISLEMSKGKNVLKLRKYDLISFNVIFLLGAYFVICAFTISINPKLKFL